MSAAHGLRTWPDVFRAMKRGEKSFELRKNDRGFAVGDVLLLAEYEPANDRYSGEVLTRRVTYVLDGEAAQQFGCQPGYCIMAVEPLPEPHIDWRVTAEDALSRLREAERERDETREAAERLKQERPDAHGMQRMKSAFRHLEQVQKLPPVAKLDYEVARAVECLKIAREDLADAKETIAKLERELAEARAEARTLRNGISSDPTEADVLELRARRALDEWELVSPSRVVRQLRAGLLCATNHAEPEATAHIRAENHVALARRLGLMGDEGESDLPTKMCSHCEMPHPEGEPHFVCFCPSPEDGPCPVHPPK